MIGSEQAIHDLTEIRDANQAGRHWWDAFWVTQTMYDCGTQWASVSEHSGNLAVRYLRTAMKPWSNKLRITINLIHPELALLTSKCSPRQIAVSCVGSGQRTTTFIRTCDKLMAGILQRVEPEDHYSRANNIAHVLGTGLMREVISANGPMRPVDAGKQRIHVGRRKVGLASLHPWEILRDASAKTLRFDRDEEIVAHVKPRSTKWIRRNYGVQINTETKMGELLDFQDELVAARGSSGNSQLARDSKSLGVLWYESFQQDPASGREWPTMFVGYSDPAKDKNRILPVPGFGRGGVVPNPFSHLPIFALHYDDKGIEMPWGRVMPWALMQHQDLSNISISWMARMLRQGGGKWIVEKRSVEKPEEAFNDDPLKIITWVRHGQYAQAPHRDPGPQVPEAAVRLSERAPQWLRESLNVADVSRGDAGKRGLSNPAIESLLSEANSTLDERITKSEGTLARMMKCLLLDTIRLSTLDDLRELIGESTPDEHIRELKRPGAEKKLLRVKVHPTTLRPKTRVQTREEFVSLVDSQVLDARTAIREMMVQSGIILDSRMRNSFDKQAAEIDSMIAGQPVRVEIADDHGAHREFLSIFTDSPKSLDLDESVQEALQKHYAEHMTTEIAKGQAQSMNPMESAGNMGSQPSPAAQPQPMQIPSEAVASANA